MMQENQTIARCHSKNATIFLTITLRDADHVHNSFTMRIGSELVMVMRPQHLYMLNVCVCVYYLLTITGQRISSLFGKECSPSF